MPTPKQEKLAKALVANAASAQPQPVREILGNIGYSQVTAFENPGQIIQSAGVQEALAVAQSEMMEAMQDKGLDPHFLADRLRQLLNKQDKSGAPDTQAVRSGLDMAFKVRGDYKVPDNATAPNTVNINFINSPAVQAAVKDFEDNLKKLLTTPPSGA